MSEVGQEINELGDAVHTPGPWLMASHASSVVGWPIVAPQAMGRVVCSLNYADPKAFGGKMPGDGAFNRESRANGLLIAAAPDLYRALEDFDNWFCGFNPEDQASRMEGRKVVIRARAALARAKAA